MPSRKKAKGKARKAAKEAKEAEARAKKEESKAAVEVAANQRQEESVEEQLQRLVISNTMTQECWHGSVPRSAGDEICLDFINAFLAVFRSEVLSEDNVAKALLTAYDATKVKYADMYSYKLDTVISMLLYCGTQRILDGGNSTARLYAMFASFFDEVKAVKVHKTQAIICFIKAFELNSNDDHTLISYYRKRIPCSCLDEKYKEVKSVKKMGLCFNPSCSLPEGMVERSKMFSCTRCGAANYCSVECQRAGWKIHKEYCGMAAEANAEFKSNQT